MTSKILAKPTDKGKVAKALGLKIGKFIVSDPNGFEVFQRIQQSS